MRIGLFRCIYIQHILCGHSDHIHVDITTYMLYMYTSQSCSMYKEHLDCFIVGNNLLVENADHYKDRQTGSDRKQKSDTCKCVNVDWQVQLCYNWTNIWTHWRQWSKLWISLPWSYIQAHTQLTVSFYLGWW